MPGRVERAPVVVMFGVHSTSWRRLRSACYAATCDSQVPDKCPEYLVLRGFYGSEAGLSRLNPAEPVDCWRVMSPTSYQAAPPRENIIANARARVKRFEAAP